MSFFHEHFWICSINMIISPSLTWGYVGCVYVLHLFSLLLDHRPLRIAITGYIYRSSQQRLKDQQSRSSSLPVDLPASLVAVVLIRAPWRFAEHGKAMLSYAYPLPFRITKLNRLYAPLWCAKSLGQKQLNKQTRMYMFYQRKSNFWVADKLADWLSWGMINTVDLGPGQLFKKSGP